MKPLGIVRKVDELGRLVIPAEARGLLGMEPGVSIEMFATDKGVFLRKYEPGKPVPTAKRIEGVEM